MRYHSPSTATSASTQSGYPRPALPDRAGTKLAAGTPLTVPVKITNRGDQAEDFFVDPRLNSATTLALAPFSQASGLSLPLVVGSPQWFMPTEATSVSVSSDSEPADRVRLRHQPG